MNSERQAPSSPVPSERVRNPVGLRLRARPAAESKLRAGHPWMFSESIRTQNRKGELGDLAAVYDRNDRFLAIGFFDPDSPIRVRVLHAGKPCLIDKQWWRVHLGQALDRRRGLFDEDTTGYRCINGESDGWPGLVLDRYDSTLVVKLYTGVWFPLLKQTIDLIADRVLSERIVLRLGRNIRRAAQNDFGLADGQILLGRPPEGSVVFLENGLRLRADVVRGQKTGFFLDQRENRRIVESLALDRDVLNAFSYTGGFSLYAARGRARSVTDLDLSQRALEEGEANWALNKRLPAVSQCRRAAIASDVFDWLTGNSGQMFDMIILDPPSFAQREVERAGAIRAYGRMAVSAARHLRAHGILVAASCSAHVADEEFFGAVRQALRSAERKFEVLRTTHHPPDHAATYPEANYLKCIFLKLDAGR